MAKGEYHHEFSPAQPCKGARCAMCNDGGVPETNEAHTQRLTDRYEGGFNDRRKSRAAVKQAGPPMKKSKGGLGPNGEPGLTII